MKIFVVGSINMDLVIKAPYMPENGVTITGSGFMSNPGGKGANQAVACSKLGADTFMVGCVGKAFGKELKETLNSYNVNTKYVDELDNVSSGIAVIVVVDSDNRIILDSGANSLLSKELIDRALKDAKEGDYLICQLEIPQDIVKYAFEVANKKGLVTVLNPAPAATLIPGILENTTYFIPNQSEAEFYTGIYPNDEETSVRVASILKEKGCKNVVITLGTKGSCAIIGDNYYYVTARKVEAVDTTGAGDTFIGAFTSQLSKGIEIKKAMEFASVAASLTCTKRGAQQAIPYLKDIKLK